MNCRGDETCYYTTHLSKRPTIFYEDELFRRSTSVAMTCQNQSNSQDSCSTPCGVICT
jgi:hypothetical protein